jgi:lysophospholipase L1-like esterase
MIYKTDLLIEMSKKKRGEGGDKHYIYNKLKKTNKNLSVVIGAENIRGINKNILPLAGASFSKTLYCNENGYFSSYYSDRFGFNNNNLTWDVSQIEYLVIGDSFAHGACVNEPGDVASQLKNLSNKPVLNLAYAGNGPLSEYATLREYMPKNVKKIIWIYFEGNDLNNLLSELNYPILKSYIIDENYSQRLQKKQKKIDKLIQERILKENQKLLNIETDIVDSDIGQSSFIKLIKLYNVRKLLKTATDNTKNTNETEIPKEFKIIMDLTNQFARKNNIQLFFVYLPEYNRYTKNYKNENYSKIIRIINELNIPIIDLHKDFFQKKFIKLIYYPKLNDGHLNNLGYKKISEIIFNKTK